MSTRPEETEAHSLDGLGGLGREEREGGRRGREGGRKDTASFLCSPTNQEWGAGSGRSVSSDRSLSGKEMSAMGRRACLRVRAPVRWGSGVQRVPKMASSGLKPVKPTTGRETVTSFWRSTTKNLNQGQEGRIIKKKLVWWGLWGACVPSEEQLCSELANSCHQGMWAQGCLLFHFWGLFFICIARNLYFCVKSSDF